MLSEKLKIIEDFARKAHKGQKDKAGKDYINHPLAVAAMLNSENEKCIALLHDVIEDTPYTMRDLKALKLSSSILKAICILTHKSGVSYDGYIKAISNNELASRVKIADLTHNMDIKRISKPSQKDYERLKKYTYYRDFLRDTL